MRSLGPANDDGVPPEELLLAQAVAAVKAEGGTFGAGAYRQYNSVSSSYCYCAAGAAALATRQDADEKPGQFAERASLIHTELNALGGSVVVANDEPTNSYLSEGVGTDFGYSYRDAMDAGERE